jgi:predicted GNAT family N-acyltransferase
VQTRTVSSPADWEAVRAVRQRVFVEEQACPPEEEWDEHDATARHLMGIVDGRVVAVARWRVVDFGGAAAAKLERFAVLPEHRGAGLGRRMFVLHAQAHLEDLYASFGFERRGEPFEEAGIPHVKMARERLEREYGSKDR